ncbi:MAG: PKD domain-containing protein [Acidimicrobiales bacterium]
MRSSRRLAGAASAAAIGITVAVAGLVPAPATAAQGVAAQGVPPDDPGRGLVWAGLVPGSAANRCEGGFEVRGRADEVLGCTHGPDPAPAGVDVRRPRPTADLIGDTAGLPAPTPGPGTNGNGLPCVGDGTSGYRVEAIYAIAGPTPTRPDRYDQIAPVIRTSYAPYVEWQYRATAVETGGEAHVPFVTQPDGTGCTLVVRHAVLSATGDDSFGNTINELKALGYNRADRRYMVWMDSNVLCGIGQIYRDNQPGQTNANNGYYTAFGRSDAGCWGYAEAHELMHNLGGVQPEAPHATAGFHCWDENDEMCYDDDGSGPVVMQSVCPGRDGRLFDCNHDDYFYAGTPPVGTWLSTHWNTWNSRFLSRTALGPPGNLPPSVDAGPNRSVPLPQAASLDGTVSDDGLPAGSTVTVAWTRSAGPGTVSFANAAAVDTTATFSAAGTYTLTLTASDSALSASDTMTVTVTDPNAPVTETFSGSFNKNRRSITHTFSSGPGTITVTVSGPSNKTITASVYAPNGSLLGQRSGTGTQTLTVTGPATGSYRLVMSGTTGSYTATVRHLV